MATELEAAMRAWCLRRGGEIKCPHGCDCGLSDFDDEDVEAMQAALDAAASVRAEAGVAGMEILHAVATVHLYRDDNPNGMDILGSRRSTITPEHVRAARRITGRLEARAIFDQADRKEVMPSGSDDTSPHRTDTAPQTADPIPEAGAPVTLDECPIGLFLSASGTLCCMTEYVTSQPADRQGPDGPALPAGGQRDAYIVETGEYFWGGTSDWRARAKLLVRPLAALPAAPSPQPPAPAEGAMVNDPEFPRRMAELAIVLRGAAANAHGFRPCEMIEAADALTAQAAEIERLKQAWSRSTPTAPGTRR